jgi:signal transduction histidine kinase/HAMP domain-containing protein
MVKLRHSLSFRLCIVLALAILGCVALFGFYFLYYESESLREGVRKELVELSGIILRNTMRSMQANHPEGIQDIIKTAGEQGNVLSVRIYTRDGTVRYASDPGSLGMTLGRDAPSCRVCHGPRGTDIPARGRDRVFTADHLGTEALAIVAPIFGERSCYEAPCHIHSPEHAVLGVLEIHRSVQDVNRSVARSLRHALAFGLVLFAVASCLSLLFLVRFVHRPVRNLLDSALRMSQGDYGLQIPPRGKDELAQLTRAFNEMSRKIEDRQKKLFQSREEFRALFDEVPAYISVLDPELRIKNLNRAYREAFGDHVGRLCVETPLGGRGLCEGCPTLRSFADGGVHSLEQVRTLPDGKEHSFLVHSAPIQEQGGRIQAVIEIFTEVTQIKELQKELVFLGEAVAGISHTIKNILGGLEGGIYVVDAAFNKGNQELLGKGWGMVKSNVSRISGLVRDILFLSRERSPALEEIDPADVCREVMELLSAPAGEASVMLELEAPGPPRTIRVDPRGLHTVLTDLVSNAIDACRGKPPQKRVAIRYGYDTDGLVTFHVEDNGPGIEPEIMEMLFKRSVSTKGSRGSGLGLLVAKKIVEQHGGKIWVESTPGKGTVFTFTLPSGEA